MLALATQKRRGHDSIANAYAVSSRFAALTPPIVSFFVAVSHAPPTRSFVADAPKRRREERATEAATLPIGMHVERVDLAAFRRPAVGPAQTFPRVRPSAR